jgi:hypothetical protein
MGVQRETGAHRAIKVIKKSTIDDKIDKSEMDAQMILAALALRNKNEKELKNEIKILCSLVSPWVMCQNCF